MKQGKKSGGRRELISGLVLGALFSLLGLVVGRPYNQPKRPPAGLYLVPESIVKELPEWKIYQAAFILRKGRFPRGREELEEYIRLRKLEGVDAIADLREATDISLEVL